MVRTFAGDKDSKRYTTENVSFMSVAFVLLPIVVLVMYNCDEDRDNGSDHIQCWDCQIPLTTKQLIDSSCRNSLRTLIDLPEEGHMVLKDKYKIIHNTITKLLFPVILVLMVTLFT